MNIGERIRTLRKAKNMTQSELAELLNTTKQNIFKYENGIVTNIPSDKIEKMAEIFGVSPAKLMGWDDKEQSNLSAVLPAGNIYQIPVFATVSAGFGSYACNDVLEYIPVVITNPYDVDDTIGIRVRGDSMYPKIEDGDIIIVRKQESVDNGSVAVLLLDGDEGLVKKVEYGKDWIELHSFNPEYMTRRFEGAEVLRLRVVGLVIGSYKKF